MKIRRRTVLMEHSMQSFKCIGSACEDTCCSVWNVTIDQETYRKYQKVRDPELKKLLNANVTRNRSTPSENNYAKIRLTKDRLCPLLTEDNLCKVQAKLGSEYLSSVCAFYPRFENMVNGVVEKSLVVSCPEAARHVLLNVDGIEFDEIEEPIETKTFLDCRLNTDDLVHIGKYHKYFWEFRIFTIQTLQNRQHELWKRLIILGMFYQKIQECIDEGHENEIPGQIAVFSDLVADGLFKKTLDEIPDQSTIQMLLLKEMTENRILAGGASKRFIECFAEFLAGIGFLEGSTMEEVAKRYQVAFENHYNPFMQKHEYILENYLVNYVFKNLFPITAKKTLFENYVMLVVHYAIIKMHLIGIAGFYGGISIDQTIKTISSFARTVEHNANYLRTILDLLRKNGYTNMAYMAILIKN